MEQRLALAVNPMKIFEDQNDRLVDAFPKKYPFNPLLSAAAPNLWVHPRYLVILLLDSEQREQIGQSVLQRAIEGEHFAGYLFTPPALVVLWSETKIIAEQFE